MIQIILSPQIVGSIGLCLDIAGVVLLFKFGLPAEISRPWQFGGWTDSDPEQIAKAKLCDRMGGLGLVLLIAGFVFQLAAIWLPR